MSILNEIIRQKEKDIRQARRNKSAEALKREAEASVPKRRGFRRALAESRRKPAVIAEIKRRSPSKGSLRENLDPAELARAYEQNGASALSVLTDREYFGGSLEDLRCARQAVSLPVLRKDFILDEYQIYEAAAWGADAVLLIAAALPEDQLGRLNEKARSLDLGVLAEVHSKEEIKRVRTLEGAMIGINNRNLRTFKVDLNVTVRLAGEVPRGSLLVSESGIKTGKDLKILRDLGVDAVLIGESLVTQEDPGAALKKMLL